MRNKIRLGMLLFVLLAGQVQAQTAQMADYAPGTHIRVPNLHPQKVLDKTVGTVSEHAVRSYGSFEDYWKSTEPSRRGKALEAISSNTVNSRMRALGKPTRWVPTSMLGNPHHAADILEVDVRTGKVLRRIQAKSGFQGVMNALEDPKYKGMDILTDADTFKELEKKLRTRLGNCQQRKIPLSGKWQRLKDALDQGQIIKRLPCGAPLRTRNELLQAAKKHVFKHWTRVGQRVPRLAKTTMNSRPRYPSAKRTGIRVPRPGRPVRRELSRGTSTLVKSSRALRGLGRTAGPVTVAVEGVGVLQKTYQGDYKGATKAAAEAAGGWAGAEAGAMAGATIGSVGGPIGVAIGGVVGGIIGGIAGAWAGEKAAEAAYDYLSQ